MNKKKIAELKRQWGYHGKPKQWQDGFDAGMKELIEALTQDAQGEECICPNCGYDWILDKFSTPHPDRFDELVKRLEEHFRFSSCTDALVVDRIIKEVKEMKQ